MSVRKIIIYGVIRNTLPNAILLHVSHLCLIEIGLADVVEQSDDGERLLAEGKAVFILKARTLYIVAKLI